MSIGAASASGSSTSTFFWIEWINPSRISSGGIVRSAISRNAITGFLSFSLGTVIGLPLALSPVVVGLALFLLYGRGGWLGGLGEHGLKILFAIPGMVLATMFVSLPFVVREVVPVLREIGTEQEQAAATLGASKDAIDRSVAYAHERRAFGQPIAEFQAVQFMPLVIAPQILLAGIIVPRAAMPDWLEWISNVMPASYALEALQQVGAHPELAAKLGESDTATSIRLCAISSATTRWYPPTSPGENRSSSTGGCSTSASRPK